MVELDDDAFDDSFDDDDDGNEESNLEPLAEGASNPLDGSDFPVDTTVDLGRQQHTAKTDVSAVESTDFGLNPTNPSPQTSPPTAAAIAAPPATTATILATTTTSAQQQPQPDNQANLMDFSFNFDGANIGSFPTTDDFFGSNIAGVGAVGTDELANMDFGTLNDNFFEKLESMEISDQSNAATLNKQDFDKFWTEMDTSVPKYE